MFVLIVAVMIYFIECCLKGLGSQALLRIWGIQGVQGLEVGCPRCGNKGLFLDPFHNTGLGSYPCRLSGQAVVVWEDA